MKKKIAFIGAGRVTKHHINILKKFNKFFKIIAICDLIESKCDEIINENKSLKIKKYKDYNKMITECEVDLVAILTPSGMHYEHALDIIKKHKTDLILEKPPTLRVKNLEYIYNLSKSKRINIFPVFQNRYNKAVKFLKKSISQGSLGKINICSVRVRWCRPQRYYDMSDWRGTFSHDGGALTNQGIHHIDLLRYLNGEVKSVKAIMRTLGSKIEVEDTALANLTFKNGSVGTLEITTAARPDDFEASISFLGSKGMAQLGGIAVNNLEIYTPNPKMCKKYSEKFPIVYGFGHLELYKKILSFYKNKKNKVIEKSDCLKTLELLNSFYVSSESNKEIVLGKYLQSKNLGKKNEKISKLYRYKK
jgi:predicted dehydrogenase